MEKGRIIELGNPNELLAESGSSFSELWKKQMERSH